MELLRCPVITKTKWSYSGTKKKQKEEKRFWKKHYQRKQRKRDKVLFMDMDMDMDINQVNHVEPAEVTITNLEALDIAILRYREWRETLDDRGKFGSAKGRDMRADIMARMAAFGDSPPGLH